MITVAAIDKIKDKSGKVIGYILMDENGRTMSVDSNKIKDVLANNEANITNLKVTKDNRLIHLNSAPDKLTRYAERMSKISGVKISKAEIDGVYARYRFMDTDFKLQCHLSSDEIYLCNGNGIAREVIDTNLLDKMAMGLKNLKSGRGTGRKSDVFTVNTSDLAGIRIPGINKLEIPDYLKIDGFTNTTEKSVISINNPNLELVINVNSSEDRKISLENCILRSLTIQTTEENTVETILLNECIIPNINIINKKYKNLYRCGEESSCTKVYVWGSLIEDKVNIANIPVNLMESAINNINVRDIAFIGIGDAIVNNINILNSYRKIDKETLHSPDLKVKIENSVVKRCDIRSLLKDNTVVFNSEASIFQTVNIKSEEDIILDVVGTYEDNTSLWKAGVNNVHATDVIKGAGSWDSTVSLSNWIESNGFNGYESWENSYNVDKHDDFYLYNFSTEGTLNAITDRELPSKGVFSTHVLEDNYKSIWFRPLSGVYVASNTNITINNILILALNIKGFIVDPSVAHDIDITITGDIKYNIDVKTDKSRPFDGAMYQQFKDISKVGTIHVYYNSPIYRRLTQAGVEVDIIDKENIPEEAKKSALKEKLIGNNYWDILNKNLIEVVYGKVYIPTCSVDIHPAITIPEDIIKFYKMDHDLTYGATLVDVITTMPYQLKSALNLLKRFPYNDLIFSDKVINKLCLLTSASRVDIHTESIIEDEEFMVFTIYIRERDTKLEDVYIVMLNGFKLIYSAYIGKTKTASFYGSIPQTDKIMKEFQKYDYIDLKNNDIKQTVTLSPVSNANVLYNSINDFLCDQVPMLWRSMIGIVNTGLDTVAAVKFEVPERDEYGEPEKYDYIQVFDDAESKLEIQKYMNKVKRDWSSSIVHRLYEEI